LSGYGTADFLGERSLEQEIGGASGLFGWMLLSTRPVEPTILLTLLFRRKHLGDLAHESFPRRGHHGAMQELRLNKGRNFMKR
jgi:hypothetical protein